MTETKSSTPQRLSASSEYALILGSGVSAAISLAAQQAAIAYLPVATLVGLGLMNRHRLDQNQTVNGTSPRELAPDSSAISRPGISAQPTADIIRQPSQPRVSAQGAARAKLAPERIMMSEDFADISRTNLQKIGNHLSQVRQEKAISLKDVHNQTFIQMYSLKAIEEGDWNSLPELVYVKAFIRKYAQFLGLDGTQLLADFPLDLEY